MYIKKQFQGEIPENKIMNSYTESNTDAYTCEYINKVNDYTLNQEVAIGKWIDGKTLYRRVIQTKTPSSSETNTNIYTLPSDFGIAIKIKSIYKSSWGQYAQETHINTSQTSMNDSVLLWITENETPKKIRARAGNNVKNVDITIILEYTKTS